MMTRRRDGRRYDELRPITFDRGFVPNSPGSVLIRAGATAILVTAQLSESVPPFLDGTGQGWLTAEYAMLPGSTIPRNRRGADGRATEIQRLIGRTLRSVLNRQELGACTIHVDADVINADGGTRTAAITGAFVALVDALHEKFGDRTREIIRDSVAAVSVGIVEGEALLDLNYAEDSIAQVDINVVGLGSGGLVEIQGTGEGSCFSRGQLDGLLNLAEQGIKQLQELQLRVLGPNWPLRWSSG